MPNEGRIPIDGLRFRGPIQELEEILQAKIQRAMDAGDKEAASLYREVLDLAREKAESLGRGPGQGPEGGAGEGSAS